MATKPIIPWFEITVGPSRHLTTGVGSGTLAGARPAMAWWQYLEQLGRRSGKA